MVDAYAGVGLFAATLAPAATTLWPSSSRGRRAPTPGVNLGRRATVIQSPVEGWRPRRAGPGGGRPVARGPRGRRRRACWLAPRRPRFVLVSCDPAALARDARLLAGAGYDHQHSTVVDLFPHTPHVEVVTSFARR